MYKNHLHPKFGWKSGVYPKTPKTPGLNPPGFKPGWVDCPSITVTNFKLFKHSRFFHWFTHSRLHQSRDVTSPGHLQFFRCLPGPIS